MEIKNENGKLKTLDELEEEAIEMMVEALDNLDEEDQLAIGNEYRDRNNYNLLFKNDEYNLNDVLDGLDPYDILRLDWDDCDEYFVYDYDLEMTNDVWYGIDEEALARDLVNEDFRPDCFPSELRDVMDECEEAKTALANYNPYRAEGDELLKKFVNCEADVADLLKYIDKLVRTDNVWKEE